jgi:DnaJ like chaperone protein
MSIWGKIAGVGLGAALGGPIGALIGLAAGHAMDRGVEETGAGQRAGQPPEATVAFTVGVIALAAKMAKADGQVTRSEVDAFKTMFQVPEREAKNVGRIFDLARRDVAGFEAYATQLARMFERRSTVLEDLLDGLFRIAMADGVFHPQEEAFLRRVAEIFGFEEHDFLRIKATHLGPNQSDPYQVLGVAHNAEEPEIRAAYRKLVKENHPDALMARGVPEEMIETATDKIARINDAYDRVAKARGFN